MTQATLEAPASARARRGFIPDDDPGTLARPVHAAPRRALNPSVAGMPRIPHAVAPERPRRRAPMRALLSRLLLGNDGEARRAMVDSDELLAAELFRLTSLDPRWGFMQSARQVEGGSELDHWAIGPGGVYLLSAKYLPGSKLYVSGDDFLVDGESHPFVPQMRGEAQRNSDLMSLSTRWDVGVTGIIVPFYDRKLTVERTSDVMVIDEVDVAGWLVNRPEQFGKRQILTAFNAARDASVWMPRFTV